MLCVILVLLSFKFTNRFSTIKTALGDAVTPMQKGINTVGRYISDKMDLLHSKKSLLEKNEQLHQRISELSYDNKILAHENKELENYRNLYKLDKKYPDYPKLAARVISRDGNNWFHVFTIDKGKKDGIQVDMNVISETVWWGLFPKSALPMRKCGRLLTIRAMSVRCLRLPARLVW